MNIFGYQLPYMEPEYWVFLFLGILVYFYLFLNFILRKEYIRVCHLNDGDVMSILDCTKIGNQLEFYDDPVKKLYGIIPLQRRQTKTPTQKMIAAAPRTWIRGPRTYRVYFTSYNSPVTIDPSGHVILRSALSLGRDIVQPTLRGIAQGSSGTTKRDWLMAVLFMVVGMFISIVLRNFGIMI